MAGFQEINMPTKATLSIEESEVIILKKAKEQYFLPYGAGMLLIFHL